MLLPRRDTRLFGSPNQTKDVIHYQMLVVVILQVIRPLGQVHDLEPDVGSTYIIKEAFHASVISRTADGINP